MQQFSLLRSVQQRTAIHLYEWLYAVFLAQENGKNFMVEDFYKYVNISVLEA